MPEQKGYREQSLHLGFDSQGWRFLRSVNLSSVSQHFHDYLEILHLECGRCQILIDGRSIAMNTDDLIVISAGSSHTFPDIVGCSFYVLQVTADFLCSSATGGEWRYLIPFLQPDSCCLASCHLDDRDPILDILQRIEQDDLKKPPGYVLNIKGQIYCLFAQLIRRGAMQYPQNETNTLLLKRLEPAIQLVENHFDQAIRIEEAARLCFLSPSHFSRLFHKATGKTFSAYIQHVRLYHARKLLSSTDLPIDLIAEQTGFASSSHLASVFRKQAGLSPAVWRRHKTASI
ncbi:MAG: helix-turn-helix domain-containing protein [Clostridia bacterium]|nr:helix-turn-helix domain-containing protein [Clostridia bacterium]